jgi:hypothetical protein
MNDSVVRFPVTCPVCSRESLAGSSLSAIVQSLAADRPLKLSTQCVGHRIAWVANEVERNQIRDYADVVLWSLGKLSKRPALRVLGAKC